jgi:hypothetical protein
MKPFHLSQRCITALHIIIGFENKHARLNYLDRIDLEIYLYTAPLKVE